MVEKSREFLDQLFGLRFSDKELSFSNSELIQGNKIKEFLKGYYDSIKNKNLLNKSSEFDMESVQLSSSERSTQIESNIKDCYVKTNYKLIFLNDHHRITENNLKKSLNINENESLLNKENEIMALSNKKLIPLISEEEESNKKYFDIDLDSDKNVVCNSVIDEAAAEWSEIFNYLQNIFNHSQKLKDNVIFEKFIFNTFNIDDIKLVNISVLCYYLILIFIKEGIIKVNRFWSELCLLRDQYLFTKMVSLNASFKKMKFSQDMFKEIECKIEGTEVSTKLDIEVTDINGSGKYKFQFGTDKMNHISINQKDFEFLINEKYKVICCQTVKTTEVQDCAMSATLTQIQGNLSEMRRKSSQPINAFYSMIDVIYNPDTLEQKKFLKEIFYNLELRIQEEENEEEEESDEFLMQKNIRFSNFTQFNHNYDYFNKQDNLKIIKNQIIEKNENCSVDTISENNPSYSLLAEFKKSVNSHHQYFEEVSSQYHKFKEMNTVFYRTLEEIAKINNINSELENNLKDITKENEFLQINMNSLQKEKNQLSNDIKNNQIKIESQKEKLVKANQMIDTHKEEKENIKEELKSVKKTLENENLKLQESNKKLDQLLSLQNQKVCNLEEQSKKLVVVEQENGKLNENYQLIKTLIIEKLTVLDKMEDYHLMSSSLNEILMKYSDLKNIDSSEIEKNINNVKNELADSPHKSSENHSNLDMIQSDYIVDNEIQSDYIRKSSNYFNYDSNMTHNINIYNHALKNNDIDSLKKALSIMVKRYSNMMKLMKTLKRSLPVKNT